MKLNMHNFKHLDCSLPGQFNAALIPGYELPETDRQAYSETLADMKQRVAAAEAILSSTAQTAREQNARLVDRVDSVEKIFARKQQQIHRLKSAIKILAFFSFMSWLTTGAFIADKVQGDAGNNTLHGVVLRSQVTQHDLAQELSRVSVDLDETRNRLDPYRNRETQSASPHRGPSGR
jgi:hypothetical protein